MSDFSMILGTPNLSTDFSKMHKRLSAAIWFVYDYDTLLIVDQGYRWQNKRRSTIKNVGLLWVVLPSCPNKRNNLPLQNEGQTALCPGRQMSDMKP